MLRHYLVWTWRTLLADPLTTLLNLLALSLGLVSFAMAVATALFLRSNDAGLPDADRIYAVSEKITSSDGIALSPLVPYTAGVVANYLRAEDPKIEELTLVSFSGPRQVVAAGKTHMLEPKFFDETFAKVIRLPLRHGDPDKAFSQPHSVVLTSETAERLFGDADPVGQTLRIAGVDATVSGVLAPLPAPSLFRTSYTLHVDLLASWDVRDQVAPLRSEPDAWDGADGFVLVKLPRGTPPDGLRAKLADFGARHVQRLQRTYEFGLVPLTDMQKVTADAFTGLSATGMSITLVLVGLGGLVLFIASLNYANLAAAKAVGRLPESGMKKVLGASRIDLLAQYLTESLALTAAALTLVLVILLLMSGPLAQATDIDLRRLLFHRPAFWLALLAGVTAATLLGGLYPAWLLSGPKAMAATLGGKVRQARSRVASVLVGLQFLAASFLLVTVGIVALQNSAMHRSALPSDGAGQLLAVDTSLDKQDITAQDVINAVRAIPGVQSVAGVNLLPWSLGNAQRRYFKDASVKGQAIKGGDTEISIDYFTVLGSHVLAGRLFAVDRGGDVKPDDDVPTVSYNVVVDRDFALAFGWSPEQAVGQSVWHRTLTGGSAPVQIIGVIENQPQSLLTNGASGTVYALIPQNAQLPLIRLALGAGSDTMAAIDHALTQLGPQIDWHHHFSDELFSQSASILITLVAALSGLALFAVIIALLGLAGMAVHTTNSRTEEIGIRKILGADHFVILRLLAWDLTKPVLIASLASWPLGYMAGQSYLSLFTGHAKIGPLPFVTSLAATIAVAWLAVGWRIAVASSKSPAEILRHE